MHQKLWSYLISLEITNVMCSAGWCDAFEKGTLSLMLQWSKAASHLKQSIRAGFAVIEIHPSPLPCMNLPADCCAGSTSVARARWDMPGFTASSRVWCHGTAKQFSILADTHSRGIPAESHSSENQRNFPLRLLISKCVAWIITQISSGSRISGTDKDEADQLYQIS